MLVVVVGESHPCLLLVPLLFARRSPLRPPNPFPRRSCWSPRSRFNGLERRHVRSSCGSQTLIDCAPSILVLLMLKLTPLTLNTKAFDGLEGVEL